MKDKPNQIEPDGLPNAKNIPISTLKGNIWYHLGLAYYLKGDFENALWAYHVFLYGIGNWYLYQKNDTTKAKKYFKRLLESGNPFSFAYLAAESDWEKLFKRP